MSARTPLFHAAYGRMLETLPGPIRRIHDVSGRREWSGRISSRHGGSLIARLLCRAARFPPAGEDAPLRMVMQRTNRGETWTRHFSSHRMRTHLRPGKARGTIEETLWPVTAISTMKPDADGVTQDLIALRVMGVPLPAVLRPAFAVRESAQGTRYLFSITVHLPWGGLLVHYDGWLETAEDS
ncbi:MAG: DUF4166 domain-containing protein [Hyphomicrobiales bacterium]